jgi:MYXO-CTERM domain-containing protein
MLSASVASAHIALISPPPRGVDQKAGPCGRAGSTRGSTVTTFAPGATITVEWDETVDHPGHYRIAFDDDGNDSFQNPNNPNDNFAQTLIEPIVDKVGGRYSQQVTLPTTPCTNCTLQLVQVMTTVVPYNSFYFQCADIIIGDGGIDPEPPAAADGGCSVAGGNGVGWLVTAGVVAGIAKRRRRRTNQCR